MAVSFVVSEFGDAWLSRDRVRVLADAVLYEGYLVWPYRRSLLKNRTRWTIGSLPPRGANLAEPLGDASWTQSECLVECAPGARVDVELRFLQVVERRVARVGRDGLEPLDPLEVGEGRILAWDEARERELRVCDLCPDELAERRRVALHVAAGSDEEVIGAEDEPLGVILRTWQSLEGQLEISARRIEPGLVRLRVRLANTTRECSVARTDLLQRTLVAAHTVLRGRDCAFVSQANPPDRLRAHAESCRNVGIWPVLVGEEGARDTVLASPLILSDYPSLPPENASDCFDAVEIEQLLALSVLALGESERRELAAADPRARAILQRVDALPAATHWRLQGAVRSFGPPVRR